MELEHLCLKEDETILIGAGSSTEISVRITNKHGKLYLVAPMNCMQKELQLDIYGFKEVN